MTDQITQNSITLSRETVRKTGGVVVLPLKVYEDLCKKAVPTYCLRGKAAERLDASVAKGLRDYREGRCKTIKSLTDLD